MFFVCSFIGNLGLPAKYHVAPLRHPRGGTDAGTGEDPGAGIHLYANSGIPGLAGRVSTTALISEIPVIARSPLAFLCVLCV